MEAIQEIEFLEKTYREKISLPENNSKKQIIICPIGHIAAGKTTVMKELSAQLGLVRISNDEIRVLVRENKFEHDHTHIVSMDLLRHYLKEGYSVAADFDCSSFETRELIEAEALIHGAKVFFIKIDPPKDWIIHKIKNMKYSPDGLFKDSSVGLSEIERSFNERKFPDIKYDYVFDTSSPSLPGEIKKFTEEIISKQ